MECAAIHDILFTCCLESGEESAEAIVLLVRVVSMLSKLMVF